jgi:hypothetical protein
LNFVAVDYYQIIVFQKLWFALSAEQPATTFSGTAPTVPTVINVLPGAIQKGLDFCWEQSVTGPAS